MSETLPGLRVQSFAVDRTRAAIMAVVAVFVGLYWLNTVQELDKNEADALEAAKRRAVFTAQSAAEAAETTLDRFRVTLRIAATAAEQGPVALALYGNVMSAGLDDMVLQLFHVSADGYLSYSSLGQAPRNFLGDREYFRTLAADPQRSFVVSPPVMGRLTNKWSLQLAQGVWVNGKFTGVMAIAVSPERWTARLARFEGGPRDVLSLFSPDGFYLLRTRDPLQSFGQQLPSDRPFLADGAAHAGTYVEPGARDGVLRLYAWQRLASGQVMVSGVALDDALAPTRELNRQTVLRGIAATLALLVAVAVILFFIRRSERSSLAIAEKETMQRVTLSAMAEGLAVASASGEILFHNDSFARILPYAQDRLRRAEGALPWDVFAVDGSLLDLAQYPSVITARTGQPFDDVILGVKTSDRDTHWLNINTRPLLGADGKPYAAILTVTDITAERAAERALKESEERYRTVVESLVEGIVVQDDGGAIIASNPAAERILGLGADELAGRHSTDPRWHAIHADGSAFPGDIHPAMVTLRTGERQEGVIMGLRKADDSVTWVEINTAPLWGAEADRPVAVVASILEITNRKEFEDELSRSNSELEQFAYAVSHDLREPLRMIAAYMQLLQRRLGADLSTEAEEFIGFAVDGAKRMDRMLVALLEYSRVGRIGQPMEWVPSRQVLEEALLFLSPVIAQTKAEITVVGDWPEIFASADEIERLFQNLLGNALKYHREGVTPVIQVGARQQGGEWRFWFTDNGIGIVSDQIGRLFKVFQRLHANDRYEGSGIGLALSRKIVQRHDGRIWVESPGPDAGSTFTFTLRAGVAHARMPEGREIASSL
ncbi:MAG: PAS domain S-box protein [Rhodospirillaceae bacterium]|nr:PAS domain S-box protein [Rhodospirillales bacterium]